MNLICSNCKKEYEIKRRSMSYLKRRKFCTRVCYRSGAENDLTKFQRGHKPSINQWGKRNSQWKGDKVSYSGLHYWVRRALGSPSKCEYCGITEANRFEWANKSHKYLRQINDWIRLCKSCHYKYDHKGLGFVQG